MLLNIPLVLEHVCRALLGPRISDLGRNIAQRRQEAAHDEIVLAFVRGPDDGNDPSDLLIQTGCCPLTALYGMFPPSIVAAILDDRPMDHTWVFVEARGYAMCGLLPDIPADEHCRTAGSIDFFDEVAFVIPPGD